MTAPKLGLKENGQQFVLLLLVNAFVGGMVGLERSILPELASDAFGVVAKTAILSFILVFGLSKAISNYYMGAMANRLGRKQLLILGWLVGLPIPIILIYANHWNWIIFANILLGINQGLAWSSTVIMKIDLVGPRQRGLAMGLNEFSGYLSVGLVALATGWIASNYGLRPYPFYLGIVLALLGLFFSIFLIKDTQQHAAEESSSSDIPLLKNIFWETTWQNPTLGSVTQAGLVNNLNDAMIWGIFPLLLVAKNYSLDQIALLTAIYPAVWGIGQLVTGKMADLYQKKTILYWGMFIQGLALFSMLFASNFTHFALLAAMLGIGTALVYPTFLTTIASVCHPSDRPQCIGIFRLWRDSGYAVGALLTGIIADVFSLELALFLIALLTLISGLVILTRMKNI